MNKQTQTEARFTAENLMPFYDIYAADCKAIRVPVESEAHFTNECLGLQDIFGADGLAEILRERGKLGAIEDIGGGLRKLLEELYKPENEKGKNRVRWLESSYQRYLSQCAAAKREAYHLDDLLDAIERDEVSQMSLHGDLLDRVDRLMRGLDKPTFVVPPPDPEEEEKPRRRKGVKR